MKIKTFTDIGTHDVNEDHHYIDNGSPMKCRFCGKGFKPELFAHDAHAISELLGNKKIFLKYECDACNKYFSAFEVELAKFMGIERAFSKIIPKETKRFEYIIDNPKGLNHKIVSIPDRNSQYVNLMNTDIIKLGIDDVIIKDKKQRFNKIKVFKAILKMAFSIMPYDMMSDFSIMKSYLMDDSNNPFVVINLYKGVEIIEKIKTSNLLLIERNTFLDIPINENLIVSLQNTNSYKKNKILNFYFYIGPSSYQIVIPSNRFLRDCYQKKTNSNLKHEDIFLSKHEINKNAINVSNETINCAINSTVKSHKEAWSLSLFLKIPVILENKKLKDGIPEDENCRIDWRTMENILTESNDNILKMKTLLFSNFFNYIRSTFILYNDRTIVSLFERFVYDNELYLTIKS